MRAVALALMLIFAREAHAQDASLANFRERLDLALRALETDRRHREVSCDRAGPTHTCVFEFGSHVRILAAQPADGHALRGMMIVGTPRDDLAAITDVMVATIAAAMMLEPRARPADRGAAINRLFPRDWTRMRDGATARLGQTEFTLRRMPAMNAITVTVAR